MAVVAVDFVVTAAAAAVDSQIAQMACALTFNWIFLVSRFFSK